MARKKPMPVEDRRAGSPAEQLRTDLERFRLTGMPFDQAWVVATGRIRWPHDTEQRHQWKGTIEGMAPAFRRRYVGVAIPVPQAAVGMLEPVAA